MEAEKVSKGMDSCFNLRQFLATKKRGKIQARHLKKSSSDKYDLCQYFAPSAICSNLIKRNLIGYHYQIKETMDHYYKLLKQYKLPRKTEPRDFFAEYPANLDEEFAASKTLLQNAIMSQDEDLVDAILEINPESAAKLRDLNVPDRTSKRWTALHYAVFNGAFGGEDMVKKLLSAGADPNVEASDGKVPLHMAAEIGSTYLIDLLLLKGGAKLNAKCAVGGVLHIALLSEKPEAFDLLLSQENIDLGITDDDGNNALHLAARYAYARELEKMLERAKNTKSIVNAQNRSGNTPLHETVIGKHKEIEMLLRKQPEVDSSIVNARNQTADQIREAQIEAEKVKESEAQMAQMRKRKLEEEKQKEKVVLGEKAKKFEWIEEEEKGVPFWKKPWGLAVIVFILVLAILYMFFYFYINKQKSRLPHQPILLSFVMSTIPIWFTMK
eukprot:TRINITY_DN602_c1_g1_i2.p4 TRINITY_DN602_c1_g1~~TRINITY_DN602_c1_g1_i2.p4  ORF type:complete len:441 (+),score=63.67 TRINITY_DN602_c1_g1_i2:6367-7689(+)